MTADWIVPIASLVLGSGFLGGIVLLLKVRPEAGAVNVVASEKVVLLQMGTIDRLEEELQKMRDVGRHVDQLSRALASLQRQFDDVNLERERLAEENTQLRARVAHLEAEVARLRAKVGPE